MLMTRERSPSDHETFYANDYNSFVGPNERPQSATKDIFNCPVEFLADKKVPGYISPPLLQQLSDQLHQHEHFHHQLEHQLSENRPCHESLRSPDLPSKGFKDVLILDKDYFVAICDNYVKLYSDIGDLLDKTALDCTPLSLSQFGQERVVITCYSHRLCIVSIVHGTSLSLLLEIETLIQYCSVSQLRNDELICVGLDKAVLHRLVYKPSLVVLASALSLVKFGVTVRHDLSYRYVHVTSSGQIVITDRMNDYVLSLSIKGNWKIPFFYRPQAVTSDGNYIYIIQGGGLNLVYRFHLDGTNAFCILRKEHALVDPWGLSLNRNRKLIVTSNSGGVPGVRVFTGLDFTVHE